MGLPNEAEGKTEKRKRFGELRNSCPDIALDFNKVARLRFEQAKDNGEDWPSDEGHYKHWRGRIGAKEGIDYAAMDDWNKHWLDRSKTLGPDYNAQMMIRSYTISSEGMSVEPGKAWFVRLPEVSEMHMSMDEIYASLLDRIHASDWNLVDAAYRFLNNVALRHEIGVDGQSHRDVDIKYSAYDDFHYLVEAEDEDHPARDHLRYIVRCRRFKRKILEELDEQGLIEQYIV